MTNIRMYVAAIQKTGGDLIQFCSPESDRFLETLEGHIRDSIATKDLDRLAIHLVDSFDDRMVPLKLVYTESGRLCLEEGSPPEPVGKNRYDGVHQEINRRLLGKDSQFLKLWNEARVHLEPEQYESLGSILTQAITDEGFRL